MFSKGGKDLEVSEATKAKGFNFAGRFLFCFVLLSSHSAVCSLNHPRGLRIISPV